jgi:ADP-heptose:LPS heptosyltransferase
LGKKTKHIAVIRLSAMGDVAMIVPVILAMTKQHPEVKITVVSRSFFKPIFETIPNVNFFSVHTHHRHKGLLGLYRLYTDLKALKIDKIADLHNVIRSKVIRNLFALSVKKVAFTDKGRLEKKALTRFKDKKFIPLKSMIKRHAETFKELGYAIDLSKPMFLNKMFIPLMDQEIFGDKKQNWIGIAPFAQYQSKVYPEDLMQKVILELASNGNNKIFLFGGGKKEIEKLTTFASTKENIKVIAGKISFEHELILISNLDIMLSMDSGNAHLSAMFGVKTITLWGATHPYAGFAPYEQPIENCLMSDRGNYPLLPTSIYGNKEVKGYEDAMRTILPKTIINKIQKELN